MDFVALLKPPPFTGTKMVDLEQLLQEFQEYMETYNKLMLGTGLAEDHTVPVDHAACARCKDAKATLELVGGQEMHMLL